MNYKIFTKQDDALDVHQIKLLQENLQNIKSDHIRWFYKEYPVAPPVSVLCQTEQNDLIGNCSLYAKNQKVSDRVYKMGVAADFAIHPKHRVFGPALKMQRLLVDEAMNDGFDLLFAFPNNNSRALFQRVGYKKLGEISDAVKVLKSKKFIDKKIKISVLANVAAKLLDFSFWFYDKIQLLFSSNKFLIKNTYLTDEVYDKFWDDLKGQYELIGEKDSKYLKWRYLNNPDKDFYFFNLLSKDNELLGVLVWSLKDSAVIIEEIVVFDMLMHLKPIVQLFVQYARKQKCTQIEFGYYGNSLVTNTVKKLLFFIKQDTRSCFVKLNENSEIDENLISSKENWILFESEMDL